MDNQCRRYQALMPSFLAGQLGAARRMELECHARSCAACEADLADLELAFDHVSERLVQDDPAFAALSARSAPDSASAAKRGQILPFPAVARQPVRSRKFGYWAFRIAAVGLAVFTAFASPGIFRSEDLGEEQRFQVASRAPLPAPSRIEPPVDYDIPPAYGLGIPL